PRAPARGQDPADAAGFSAEPPPGRSAAVPGVQLAGEARQGRDHRLGRHHRGSYGDGRAVPDTARYHRAARNHCPRYQRADWYRPDAIEARPGSAFCRTVEEGQYPGDVGRQERRADRGGPGAPARNLMSLETLSRYRSEEHTSELQSRENLVC